MRARAAAAALGVVVFLEMLRVWMPSVLFVYGLAGSASPLQIGRYALVPFLLALPGGLLAVRWLRPRRVELAAGALLGLSRLALPFLDGGTPQLAVSSLGVTAGLAWLVALAGGGAPAAAGVGVVVGVALDAVLHAGLHSVDLAWRPGLAPALAAVVVVSGWVVASWRSPAESDVAETTETGRGLPWLTVGPLFALLGIVGTTSRLSIVAGLTQPVAVAVTAAAFVLTVAAVVAAARSPARVAGIVAAVCVLAGLAAVLALPPYPVPSASPLLRSSVPSGVPLGVRAGYVAGYLTLVVGLGLAVGGVAWAGGPSSGLRRAAAAAAGLVLLFLVVFGYYANYDLRLPVPSWAFVVLGGLVAAAVAATGAARRPARPAASTAGAFRPVVAGVALAGALAVVGMTLGARPATSSPGSGYPLRVMTYNLHMGFAVTGRFDVDALAAVIAGERPDVVALQEVARGWMTTGDTDLLPRLAQRVGMPYVFGPAADDVWGNAVLSRYPMREASVALLPRAGTPMRRSVLSLLVDIPGGGPLGVVATHLQHRAGAEEARLEQATQVARAARAFTVRGLPVVVLGDMNAEPGEVELEPFQPDLVDHVTGTTPPTFPSWAPVEHIDHVFTTRDLVAADLRVSGSQASDHRPVALTLRRAP